MVGFMKLARRTSARQKINQQNESSLRKTVGGIAGTTAGGYLLQAALGADTLNSAYKNHGYYSKASRNLVDKKVMKQIKNGKVLFTNKPGKSYYLPLRNAISLSSNDLIGTQKDLASTGISETDLKLRDAIRKHVSPAFALHEFGHKETPRAFMNTGTLFAFNAAAPLAGYAMILGGKNKKQRNIGMGLLGASTAFKLGTEGYASYRALKALKEAGGKAEMMRGLRELAPAFGTYAAMGGVMLGAGLLLNKYKTDKAKREQALLNMKLKNKGRNANRAI